MSNLTITGTRKTELDNNLRVTSESIPGQTILVVDPSTNWVAINKTTPTTALDINGAVRISNVLAVQTNKLIVDSSGRVGVNVTPTTNQFHVVGNVFIDGNLDVQGTLTAANTSNLQIKDTNIVINKNGSDATADGAGITIDRVSTDASLIWHNTSTNFRAGLLGSETALIRDGGNTNAAAITIGTNDAFALNLETNNTTRISIASAGTVTVPTNNLLIPSGDMFIQGVSVKGGSIPPGTIIQFIPGTYGNGSNGSFALASAIATNDAAGVNAWLVSIGFTQWKVCNGASYNVAGSALYSGAGKFTPNLTDDRFLQGSTTSAAVGGSNGFSHTHTATTSLPSINLTHSHVTDSVNAIPTDTLTTADAGSAAACSATVSPNSHPSLSHCHSVGSHTHGVGSYVTAVSSGGGLMSRRFGSSTFTTVAEMRMSDSGISPSSSSYGEGLQMIGATGPGNGSPVSPALSTTPHSHSFPHTHTMPHTHTVCNGGHNHGGGGHTHTMPNTTIPGAQFSHTHTLGSSSVSENRPKFLTCFYLIRIA